MDVGLLGPLVITREGSRLDLTGPKRRALLILLALHAGAPVTVDRIIEALWPGDRTGREDATLRVHVSHLRDQLEPDRGAEPRLIITAGSGYMLALDHVELDVLRFETLATEGRALLGEQPAAAVERLDAALRLWRGRPLQDVEYEEFAQEWIRRLDAARVEVLEDRAEALLATGQGASAVEDLESMVRTHPMRERPVLLLMRTLYQTGRQPDALRTARRHTRHLAEEGLEPSPRLAMLEDQILTHDPSLFAPGFTAPEDIRSGHAVRGYELREEVGSGSVGVVYRAFQPSVGRDVAVKVIHPDLARIPDFVRRFTEEARLVARLQHPHIVPLHDFWREPAGAFLVMRWMEGGSLETRLGKPWTEVAVGSAFAQIASALEYAHSTGIVHRDIQPSNVLFDGAGNAYLADFGLAVAGVETGGAIGPPRSVEPPYAAPETTSGEGPTVASDIYALGMLLAEVLSSGGEPGLREQLDEVVRVATSRNPADRYPDAQAFSAALADALGPANVAVPRRMRRNPYKGLAPFEESDRADFYGRDDAVEQLLDALAAQSVTAVIGASGSGKSSLIKAGLIPQLRRGALPGSDEWAIVEMVPGMHPFEEFHLGVRSAALSHRGAAEVGGVHELREAFDAALDGPSSRGLLFVDQFEEVFSTGVDDDTRNRFLENLTDLASDPGRRIRVVLTLRADFADRPLAHPRLGDLIARNPVLLAPMHPEQLEDVIRRPAARVGVGVEPGLVSEIVRDLASAPAHLPLLQYVLSELFERRTEDRLTVQAYRSLGGVRGVLERRAEETFSMLASEAQSACRQLFLRMVHLGAHGEETRRRLPLTETRGLGAGRSVDDALDSFASARLLTYDRDPVTRTPTVEVAHETVIRNWTRYRVWIDEARADLLVHRRVSNAAVTWTEAFEDPSYLLSGGPLVAAKDVVSSGRVRLNELEARFVGESEKAEEAARRAEIERRRQEDDLRERSRRRLLMGIGAAAVAVVVGLLAVFAFVQRQRATDLAASQERRSLARELAALSGNSLSSPDPNLGLLLAIASAEATLEAEGEILPEAVDALHAALIDPRPELAIEGAAPGNQAVEYSGDGAALAMLARGGDVSVVEPATGEEIARVRGDGEPAIGIVHHPSSNRVAIIHAALVREWDWESGDLVAEYELPEAAATTARYSRDGSQLAVGAGDGAIHLFDTGSQRLITTLTDPELEGPDDGDPRVLSIAFGPSGARLASSTVDASSDGRLVVWDIASGQVAMEMRRPQELISPIRQLVWQPLGRFVVGITFHGETLAWDGATGERHTSFGNGNSPSSAIAFGGPGGAFVVVAGGDGVARAFGVAVGGEHFSALAGGGVPMVDVATRTNPSGAVEVATVGADGRVLIWSDIILSELPPTPTEFLGPRLSASEDGRRLTVAGSQFWYGFERQPFLFVMDTVPGEIRFSAPVLDAPEPVQPAMTADGSRVAYVGSDGSVRLATVESGVEDVIVAAGEIPYQESVWIESGTPGIRIALSSDGGLLAWSGPDGVIRVWDVVSNRQIHELRGHGDRDLSVGARPRYQIEVLEFRPGTPELASAGHDGTIRVWDTTTGEGRVLVDFSGESASLSYSSDGTRLAVADRLGTVWIVDTETSDVVQELEPVPGSTVLAFSPDGERVTGSGPGPFVHVWDVETGRLAHRLEGSVYWPGDVVFLNGGRQILVASTEGVIRGYHLDHRDLLDAARNEVGREMTEAECIRYLVRSCGEWPPSVRGPFLETPPLRVTLTGI